MPRLSDSMTEGTIVRWLKADGDEVQRGEEIVEVETDKATVGYEAEASGPLSIRAPEGAVVAVGAVIAVLGAVEKVAATARVKASPLARRVARELGVELSGLSGSGPQGRVIKSDVMAAAGNGGDGARGAVEEPREEVVAPSPADGEVVELTRTQSLIARRMAESRGTVPEFSLEVDVDMTGALEMRRELKAVSEPAPSLNDIIVKACALALRRHPRANGSFAENGFVLHPRVNVAIAVAVEGSLLTPVVRDAETKSVGEIARETRRLIERAPSRPALPRRARRRDVHRVEPGDVRDRPLRGDHQRPAVGDPVRRRDPRPAGRPRRRGRHPADGVDDAGRGSPDPLRGRRRGVSGGCAALSRASADDGPVAAPRRPAGLSAEDGV